MAWVESGIKCHCGEVNTRKFRKPSHYAPTFIGLTCDVCESEYMVKVFKGEKGVVGSIKIFMNPTFVSPTLKNILLSKAQLIAAAKEKQDVQRIRDMSQQEQG